jgi:hypothetical protein
MPIPEAYICQCPFFGGGYIHFSGNLMENAALFGLKIQRNLPVEPLRD